MLTLQKRVITAVATGAILLNALAPVAFADTTIEISGNGSKSDNTANVTKGGDTTVVQSNNAVVKNNVSSNASTGGNSANDNTGGDVTVKTGDASNTVNVSTQANVNKADVANCNCEGDTKVKISGNGSNSDNSVKLKQDADVSVYQDNYANIKNDVDANAKTGGNDANRNTGGDVTIDTGNATTNVTVSNSANANIANVGGDGHNGGGKLDLLVVGNGSKSDNDIRFTADNDTLITQSNDANIRNYVDANAKTGNNDANDNTGGDVSVTTGNAKAWVGVDNNVNFNMADADCSCVGDTTAKIADNGSDSDNDIKAKLGGDLDVFQTGNDAYIKNDADANAKTGDNDANRNGGGVQGGDPMIDTGNATSNTSVDNSGNVNVFGAKDLEDMLNDVHFEFHFDLGDLMGFFQIG